MVIVIAEESDATPVTFDILFMMDAPTLLLNADQELLSTMQDIVAVTVGVGLLDVEDPLSFLQEVIATMLIHSIDTNDSDLVFMILRFWLGMS
jgi:hypothetical protein